MKHNVRYVFLTAGLTAALSIGVFGCGSDASNETSDSGVSLQEKSDEIKLAFDVEEYQQKFSEERMAISDCSEQYRNEIEQVKANAYQNLHFEVCEFADFPETEELNVFVGMPRDFSPQEAFDMIEDWLESVGKLDEVDLKTQVRSVSLDLGEDGEWPLLYDHMSEAESGAGAYVDGKDFHLQTLLGGIFSMSDGTIAEYLGYQKDAIVDAMGDHATDVVESGTYDEMKEKEYELIGGLLTVQEGAQQVKEYFEAGTPFPCEEGVTVDIVNVSVFRLKDVYGYDYMLRRMYDTVPFAYMDTGGYQYNEFYSPASDIKHAYVVNDTGVSAFHGYNESESLIPLVTENEMLSFGEITEHVSESLASMLNIDVESAGVVYFPVTFQKSADPTERIILPCWEFAGINRVKNEYIRVYADAFTGDIYYYTFGLQE